MNYDLINSSISNWFWHPSWNDNIVSFHHYKPRMEFQSQDNILPTSWNSCEHSPSMISLCCGPRGGKTLGSQNTVYTMISRQVVSCGGYLTYLNTNHHAHIIQKQKYTCLSASDDPLPFFIDSVTLEMKWPRLKNSVTLSWKGRWTFFLKMKMNIRQDIKTTRKVGRCWIFHKDVLPSILGTKCNNSFPHHMNLSGKWLEKNK